MNMLIRLTAILVCFAVSGPQGVRAQGNTDDKPPVKAQDSGALPEAKKAEHESLQTLVQEVMAARLSKELGLDEQETVLLLRRLTDYRTQLSGVQKERQESLKALKTLLRANGPEKEIETALGRLQSIDMKVHDLKRSAYDKIGAGMNVARRARLYVYCNEFENEMRRLVQKAREKNVQGKAPGTSTEPQPARKE